MIEDDKVGRVAAFADLVINSEDQEVKFRASVKMMKSVFEIQKNFLVSVRDLVKDKESLSAEEINAVRGSVESLLRGVAVITKLYDAILSKEYKVN